MIVSVPFYSFHDPALTKWWAELWNCTEGVSVSKNFKRNPSFLAEGKEEGDPLFFSFFSLKPALRLSPLLNCAVVVALALKTERKIISLAGGIEKGTAENCSMLGKSQGEEN